MKALLQRVSQASVSVAGEMVGQIDQGLLVFLGVDKHDTQMQADKLLSKILRYRVFSDDQGRMNRSVLDVNGGLLLVSQFTLSADTRKGLRPSFTSAADPALGQALYDHLVVQARAQCAQVATGRFGADMQVALVNDGPVTFLLES